MRIFAGISRVEMKEKIKEIINDSLRRKIFYFSIILISALLLSFGIFQNKKEDNLFEILEVVEGDLFYIDINKNKVKDQDELFHLNLVNVFPSVKSAKTSFISKIYSITQEEAIELGKGAKKFSKNALENKFVKVDILSKANENKDYGYVQIFLDNIDYAKILLREGWGYSYNPEKYDYYLAFEDINKIHKNASISKPKITQPKKPEIKYITDDIEIYLINPTITKKPSAQSKTTVALALIKEIKKAKSTIYFALYDFNSQDEIYNALLQAKVRGVKVLGVADYSSKQTEENKYLKSFDVIKDTSDTLMHNKFFIFDSNCVFTGSMNLTSTGSGGYNSNVAIIMRNKEIAKIYENEFFDMRKGNFQYSKTKRNLPKVKINDKDILSIYFTPKGDVFNTHIRPIIKNAKKEILVSAFYLTHKGLTTELLEAEKRGVKIKIILDAVGASSKASKHRILRDSRIDLKVENWGGKNHEKSILIDNKYLITGSANLSYSGYNKNDENIIIIESEKIGKIYKEHFNMLYNSIDDKYLVITPQAESIYSINSCTDGIDNDYDGLIDKEDPACTPKR